MSSEHRPPKECGWLIRAAEDKEEPGEGAAEDHETLMLSGHGSVCDRLLAWVGQVLLLGCVWHWLKTPVCQAWQDAGCGWVTGEQAVCSPCLLGTLGSSRCTLPRCLCSNTVSPGLCCPRLTPGEIWPSRHLHRGSHLAKSLLVTALREIILGL